jgi:hypothetical protein
MYAPAITTIITTNLNSQAKQFKNKNRRNKDVLATTKSLVSSMAWRISLTFPP